MSPRSLADLAGSRIPLPGTTNVRDLAGYPGTGNTVVGPHRLLRGELLTTGLAVEQRQAVLDAADAASSAAFAALGLRTVLDLRSRAEAAASASAWGTATGAEMVLLPIEEGGEGTDTHFVQQLLSGERAAFSEADLTAFYVATLERHATTFVAVVDHLSRPEHLPALVHCSAGKDRTGLAVALVLELLGTPRAVVVEDYARTEVFRPDRVSAYRGLFEAAGRDVDVARALFGTPARSMSDLLARLDRAYGGAARYLVEAGGLEPDRVERLRAALLVPAAL